MTDFVRQIVREALNEGYWGHMPEDGDYPSDLMYDIDGAVNKTLKDKTFKKKKRKKPKNQDKWAQIGVMNNLFKKGGWLEKKYIKICLDYLKSLKDDDEWQKEWTEPKTIKKNINTLIKAYQKILDDNKNSDSINTFGKWNIK